MRSVAFALLVSFAVPSAYGQTTAYTRSPKDTLRFREVSTGTMTLETPNGPVSLQTEHDGTIALTFVAGDTARAWYEALAVGVVSPMGAVRPLTTEALRQPFTLTMDERGHVRILRTPQFPESFKGVTDLTRQFNDYFLSLPTQPLRPGLAWTDTVVHADTASATAWFLGRRMAQYRVERDTVVDGQRALVISARQQQSIEGRGAGPQPGVTARSVLAGGDEGVFVFAPATGRLLGRTRTGKLDGTLTFEGGPAPVAMSQHLEYRNTLTAVR